MTASDVLTIWFLQFLSKIPETLACLGLCIWVLVRWGQTPASRGWALLGFVLLLVLALLSPGLSLATRYWIVYDALPAKNLGIRSMIYAVCQSTLYALAYGFLAAAIYIGRRPALTTSAASNLPPPLPRPQPPPLP